MTNDKYTFSNSKQLSQLSDRIKRNASVLRSGAESQFAAKKGGFDNIAYSIKQAEPSWEFRARNMQRDFLTDIILSGAASMVPAGLLGASVGGVIALPSGAYAYYNQGDEDFMRNKIAMDNYDDTYIDDVTPTAYNTFYKIDE